MHGLPEKIPQTTAPIGQQIVRIAPGQAVGQIGCDPPAGWGRPCVKGIWHGLHDKIWPHVFSPDLPQNAVMLVSGSVAVAIAHAGDRRRAFKRRHAVDRDLRQFGRQVGADIRRRRAPVLACCRGSLRIVCRHRRRARVRCTCLPLGFSD